MAKTYNFYCIICGTAFVATKKHARCCSSECRVVLSNLMRYEEPDGEHIIAEPIDKEETAEKYEKVTGKEIHKGSLNQHPDKTKTEEEGTAGKLLKKKGKKKDEK